MRLRVLLAIHLLPPPGPLNYLRAWLRRAGFRVRAVDSCGHCALFPGRTSWKPAWLKDVAPRMWPFGLHSVFVAEESGGRAGSAT